MATSSFTKNFVVTSEQYKKMERTTSIADAPTYKVKGFVSKLVDLNAVKFSKKVKK